MCKEFQALRSWEKRLVPDTLQLMELPILMNTEHTFDVFISTYNVGACLCGYKVLIQVRG